MRYLSTRGGIDPIGFCETVMMGLATDGGLIIPESIPDATPRLDAWRTLSYPDLAYQILSLFVGDEIPPADLRALVDRSYATFSHPEIAPVVKLDDALYVQELFHGPTLAFKDVALQLLGNLFEYLLKRDGGSLNILGATSGDTGSAAIHGVRGKDNINIFILHPYKRTSPLQEQQMTSVLDDNVYNVAITGSFDDGQRIVKELFGELDFKRRYALGAVNSVNWARVLAQIVYYFYGAFRVCEQTGRPAVRVAVPTGNFGDIFAGYLAVRMGAPIAKLILATNENDILSRFFHTGIYAASADVHQTLSPSMDIQVASNFERYLYYHLDQDAERLRFLMACFKETAELRVHQPGPDGVDPLFVAGTGDTADTLDTIGHFYRLAGYVLDPHTAVGVAVARRTLDATEPTICLATAHPAKFPDAVRRAVGEDIAHHPTLDALDGKATRCAILPPETDAIRDFIVDKLG